MLPSQSQTWSSIHKQSLDIYNRLHSIDEDNKFVDLVRQAYAHLPILPNLRCGAWYIDPAATQGAAYFKSTDGHNNNWSFNLRRPNLHLLPMIVKHGGILLVDSTRSGKRMPDALSKTVPIWCAVVNRADELRTPFISPEKVNRNLHTPPACVSKQEHSQIEKRIESWAKGLADSSYELTILCKPLRPIWITPASTVFPSFSPDAPFYPVICISASRFDSFNGRTNYVQGSGDDHELWGMGLTPQIFWTHKAALLAASREDLSEMVSSLVSTSTAASLISEHEEIAIQKVKDRVSMATTLPRVFETQCTYVVLSSNNPFASSSSPAYWISTSFVNCEGSTKRKDVLRDHILPQVDTIPWTPDTKLTIVFGVDEEEHGIATTLLLLQRMFTDAAEPRSMLNANQATKQSIRSRLEWIIASRPTTNPSRATLQRINEYLMSPHHRPT